VVVEDNNNLPEGTKHVASCIEGNHRLQAAKDILSLAQQGQLAIPQSLIQALLTMNAVVLSRHTPAIVLQEIGRYLNNIGRTLVRSSAVMDAETLAKNTANPANLQRLFDEFHGLRAKKSGAEDRPSKEPPKKAASRSVALSAHILYYDPKETTAELKAEEQNGKFVKDMPEPGEISKRSAHGTHHLSLCPALEEIARIDADCHFTEPVITGHAIWKCSALRMLISLTQKKSPDSIECRYLVECFRDIYKYTEEVRNGDPTNVFKARFGFTPPRMDKSDTYSLPKYYLDSIANRWYNCLLIVAWFAQNPAYNDLIRLYQLEDTGNLPRGVVEAFKDFVASPLMISRTPDTRGTAEENKKKGQDTLEVPTWDALPLEPVDMPIPGMDSHPWNAEHVSEVMKAWTRRMCDLADPRAAAEEIGGALPPPTGLDRPNRHTLPAHQPDLPRFPGGNSSMPAPRPVQQLREDHAHAPSRPASIAQTAPLRKQAKLPLTAFRIRNHRYFPGGINPEMTEYIRNKSEFLDAMEELKETRRDDWMREPAGAQYTIKLASPLLPNMPNVQDQILGTYRHMLTVCLLFHLIALLCSIR